jgi:hypothetical protein
MPSPRNLKIILNEYRRLLVEIIGNDKEYAKTACEWAVQFISAAEVLLQRRK